MPKARRLMIEQPSKLLRRESFSSNMSPLNDGSVFFPSSSTAFTFYPYHRRRRHPNKIEKSPTLLSETQGKLAESKFLHPKLSALLFKEDQYSLHHKISQSLLKLCYEQWEANNTPDGAFKQAIALCENCTEANGLQALLNAPFNLELGPRSELRKDDPGSGFDPSHYTDGDMTPRSKAMHLTLNRIYRTLPRYDVVGKAIKAAYDAHVNTLKLSEHELSKPLLSQWHYDYGDGKWTKLPPLQFSKP